MTILKNVVTTMQQILNQCDRDCVFPVARWLRFSHTKGHPTDIDSANLRLAGRRQSRVQHVQTTWERAQRTGTWHTVTSCCYTSQTRDVTASCSDWTTTPFVVRHNDDKWMRFWFVVVVVGGGGGVSTGWIHNSAACSRTSKCLRW